MASTTFITFEDATYGDARTVILRHDDFSGSRRSNRHLERFYLAKGLRIVDICTVAMPMPEAVPYMAYCVSIYRNPNGKFWEHYLPGECS